MSISIKWRKLQALNGWQAWLTCYASGTLMAFAFAPFFFWPVLFLSLGVFYIVLDSAPTHRAAASRGFFFGYGYFMAGTWWIANALLVDVAKFGWMIPFCVLGLSAVLALWFALFGVLVRKLRVDSLPLNLVTFAALWVAVEYLRSVGIFGFPWNLAGYTALASLPVAQLASVVGTFGLSLLVVGAGVAPVLTLLGTTRRVRIAGIALPILILVAAYGYGTARLPEKAVETATIIRIVQPNIPQAIKSTAQGHREAAQILAQLSADTARFPDATMWPETAFPGALRGRDTGSAWPYSGLLISGAVRVEEDLRGLRVFNSIVALDKTGMVQQWYDKHQLVPFGEFVPLRSVLPLEKITPGNIDFSRGAGARTLTQGTVPPFSPLVCYEVIFPWMAVDRAHRPAWIVNATNDGWYGDSPGPYQHFAMARMRAIEQGLPLARAANNGISGIIDPFGRVVAMLPLDARGAVDAVLPAALPPTLYARFGEGPMLISIIFVILLTIPRFLRRRDK